MAVEENQAGGLPEGDDVRRRALLRLGVAGVVTAAALAGLWWLDRGSTPKPVKALPTPIAMAPPQETTPPQPPPGEATPAPEPAPATSTEPAEETLAAKPHATSGEAPPPPRVSNAPRHPAATHAPVLRAAHQPTSLTPAEPYPAVRPENAGTERFVVQLGVFSNPEHARELVNKLNKQGIHAHMETRVQLGPFENRADAEIARVEMQKLGMRALLTPVAAMK